MTDQRPLVEKMLELVVAAPARLIGRAATDLPTAVAEVRARVENKVKVAHWIGEMAVTTGRQELGRRLRPTPPPALDTPVAGQRDGGSAVAPRAPIAPVSRPPFEGYDELAAAQIVQLLPRLPHADLRLIHAYEAAGRSRRTILHRIQQLVGE
jgi:hypothetical protein